MKSGQVFKSFDRYSFHIELTEKCNAACPMCARNVFGGKQHSGISTTEITLEQFKSFFTHEMIATKVTAFSFGGNYGDPTLATELIPILKYIIDCRPDMPITLESNGGTNTPLFWEQLGSILQNENQYCSFSIDGIEDTNHLYRQNVSWQKLINNIKAYITSGGFARWNYIIFKHNEHQINKARILANSLGFKAFRLKKSSRFDSSMSFPVYDRNGLFTHKIEVPAKVENTNEKYHPQLKARTEVEYPKKLVTDGESQDIDEELEKYIDTTIISCKSISEKSLYLSASGNIFPCCFISWAYKSEKRSIESQQIHAELFDRFSLEECSILQYSLEEILQSNFFNEISKSWTKDSFSCGKLAICSLICGKDSQSFTTKTL